jgi:hypothetical protein
MYRATHKIQCYNRTVFAFNVVKVYAYEETLPR